MNDAGMATPMESSEKALTIHLYRVDEVLACFRQAILSRNTREALFWGMELFDSDCEMRLFELLTLIWLNQIGLGGWGVFQTTWTMWDSGELDRDELQKLLVAWCRVEIHDASAFVVLARGLLVPTSWKPEFPHKKVYENLEGAVEDCLKRKKVLEAWLLARGLTPETHWKLVEKLSPLATSLKNVSFGSEIQRRAMAFVACCSVTPLPAKIKPKDLPGELASLVAEWDTEENLRKRRVFPIRIEALGWLAPRGSLPTSDSTETDLCWGLEESLWMSPYWRKILETYHTKFHEPSRRLIWHDNCKEAFYDTYFPWTKFDIPDEWSAADRQKSHHRGAGKKPDVARIQILQNLLRTCKTSVLWNGLQGIKVDAIPDLNCDTEYANLQQQCASALTWPLQPVGIAFEAI